MEGSVYSGGSPLSWKNIEEYSAQFPGESPADVASRLLQELTDEAIRAFATLHITHVITHFRREQSRNVERSNELVTTAPSSSAPSEMGRKGALLTAEEWHSQSPEERQAREKAAYLSVAEWYRKPAKERRAIEEAERAERRALREQEHQEWLKKGDSPDWHDLRDNPSSRIQLTRRAERERFKDWMGVRFHSWYAERHRLLTASGDEHALEMFQANWHSRGVLSYCSERREAFFAEVIECVAASTRLKVTQELLATSFALGDGTKTTWGNATREQHQLRLDYLTAHIQGTSETAARHWAAILMLDEAGATCLRELTNENKQREAEHGDRVPL